MRYPLSGLLRIRDLRIDAAQKALVAAETEVREARAQKAQLEEELADYRRWRQEEVERRYRSILHTAMTMEALDKFKAGLSELAQEEVTKADNLLLAEKAVEAAEACQDAAKTEFRHANREREKIRHHQGEWAKIEVKEVERLEDLEMEEFRPLVFVDEDWR